MVMTMEDVVRLKVIDTDSHVTESPDLWTSRLSRKWHGREPRRSLEPANDPDGRGRHTSHRMYVS